MLFRVAKNSLKDETRQKRPVNRCIAEPVAVIKPAAIWRP